MTSANTRTLTGPNQSIEGVSLPFLQPRIVLKFGSSVLQDPSNHPLARVRGAENRLLVRTKGDRRWIFEGTGAGRSPTTEAIIGDLLAHANVQETIDSDDQEVTR